MSSRKPPPIIFDKAQRAFNTKFASKRDLHSPLHDFVGHSLSGQLSSIRKEFNSVAFIGNGAEYFFSHYSSSTLFLQGCRRLFNWLQNAEKTLKNAFICSSSLEHVENSVNRVSGIPEMENVSLFPVVLDEEYFPFKRDSLDLVVTSLGLTVCNNVEAALMRILESLAPDGIHTGMIFGSNTLSELQHAFLLAEYERSGGVSPRIHPFFNITAFGNLFARCGFKLPSVIVEHLIMEFPEPLDALEYIQGIGEGKCLLADDKRGVQKDLMLAAMVIHKVLYGNGKKNQKEQVPLETGEESEGVPLSFEFINYLGWKESDQTSQPKKRGTKTIEMGEFLKQVHDVSPENVKMGSISEESEEAKESEKV